jgi:NTP pyrophosphatase (non-canonical NTP hydrolase)
MDLVQLQKEIFQHKEKMGFNVTDVGKEIILMTEELGEIARAYKNSDKKLAREISNKEKIADEIADLTIYCLGLFEMLGVNSSKVIERIMENNRKRTHSGHM